MRGHVEVPQQWIREAQTIPNEILFAQRNALGRIRPTSVLGTCARVFYLGKVMKLAAQDMCASKPTHEPGKISDEENEKEG